MPKLTLPGGLKGFLPRVQNEIFKTSGARHFQSGSISPTLKDAEKYDVCIVGGGLTGLSTAYWIKSHPAGRNLRIAVIDKTRKTARAPSIAGLRKPFSVKENIELAFFGNQFLKDLDKWVGGNVRSHEGGYLFLASSPEHGEVLHKNWKHQRELGTSVELLSQEAIKERFPFLTANDLELGIFVNQPWYDHEALLRAFRSKGADLGVEYINGEVTGFRRKRRVCGSSLGPRRIIVQTSNGESKLVVHNHCVISAGGNSGKIADLAGIGTSPWLQCPLPIEPRKRFVYEVQSDQHLSREMPMVSDTNGVHCRGASPGHFICGIDEEAPNDDSRAFFDNQVRQKLASRVPALGSSRMRCAWTGYHDYNSFADHNGIMGTHPVFNNFHFATGFSGYGLEQAPAVGRAMMEQILYGRSITIDLHKLSFDRFLEPQNMAEGQSA